MPSLSAAHGGDVFFVDAVGVEVLEAGEHGLLLGGREVVRDGDEEVTALLLDVLGAKLDELAELVEDRLEGPGVAGAVAVVGGGELADGPAGASIRREADRSR